MERIATTPEQALKSRWGYDSFKPLQREAVEAALSQEKLGERLAFKGGTAIKRCYVGDYRFSEDLDFTLTEETVFEDIRQGLEPVRKALDVRKCQTNLGA